MLDKWEMGSFFMESNLTKELLKIEVNYLYCSNQKRLCKQSADKLQINKML